HERRAVALLRFLREPGLHRRFRCAPLVREQALLERALGQLVDVQRPPDLSEDLDGGFDEGHGGLLARKVARQRFRPVTSIGHVARVKSTPNVETSRGFAPMAPGITLAQVAARRRALSMRTKRIGVLCGGLSAEREVSLRTGEAICATLVDRGYDAVRIYVDRDLDLALRQTRIDVAFLALHGRYGEDGCVQGLLELLGIPYTGSGVMASAVAMNKVKAKELFRLHGLPTPPYYVVSARAATSQAHGPFPFPPVST